MARIRTLKPDFFLDSKIAKKSPLARLLFQGLWIHADKKGRLEEDQERLKIQILPYDKTSIEKLLCELAPDHILRYEVDGKRYIQVKNFEKHQRPHPKEPESECPPVPKTETVKKHFSPCKEIERNSEGEGLPVGKEGKGKEGVSLMDNGKGVDIVAPSGTTKSAKAKAPPKDPDGSYQRCVDHLFSTWVFNGSKYPFTEIDGKNIKWLLANYGEAKTKAVMDVFWMGCDEWTLEKLGRTTKGLRHDLAKILDSDDVVAAEKKYAQAPAIDVSLKKVEA